MGKWPKQFPPLTTQQQAIADDFMLAWHQELPAKYGIVDRFNHGYPVKYSTANFERTLEVGAGTGEHIAYEKLNPLQRQNYYALELRENMAEKIRERFPEIQTVVGDCQEKIPFPDGFFDRVIAVHVLEHLHNLPAALLEIYRVTNKARGNVYVVIPCEGSLAYSLARKISARRFFEKRYGMSYDWLISREHVNHPEEILEESRRLFQVTGRKFFPFPLPLLFCNLVLGLTLYPKRKFDA